MSDPIPLASVAPSSTASASGVGWDCTVRDGEIHDQQSERGVLWVVLLTAAMMVAELVFGYWSDSLALIADGWHMASHAGALGLSALAYWMARTRAGHRSFVFGTGKIYSLAGYTNAIVLALVAVWMVVEAVRRLRSPHNVHYSEALPVAVLGLVVNLISVKLLHVDGKDGDETQANPHAHPHGGETHAHGGEAHVHGGEMHVHAGEAHKHKHKAHDHDHNLRSAYLHVLADALTSVLAIGGLLGGMYMGWAFLDPGVGLVGAAVILRWSVGLCRGAARQLLDLAPSENTERHIRETLSGIDDVQISDLHLWEIGPGRYGCVVSIRTQSPRDVGFYRSRLLEAVTLAHLTVEVHRAG